MSAESRALFDALLMLFEVLMAVFMEKHTPKSSANSSLPASQSPNDDTARIRPGAKGREGPSHNGERCANTRTRESIRVLTVDACQRCGEDLTDAACTGRERRTLIDIVFEKVVRHVDAQIKHCARCHTETRARFPHEMPGPLRYGPGIKAYVVHLLIAQMLSLKRVAQSMHALIGRTLSEATLLAARPLEDERRLGRHAMPSDIRATGHPSRTVNGLGERATIRSRSATVRTAWNHNRGPPASVMPASNRLKSSIWPEPPLRGREHPAFQLRLRCLAVRQAPLAEGGELPDDGKLQQRRLDVRYLHESDPCPDRAFDCAPDPFHAGANLGTMEHGQRQKGAEPRGRVLAPERCWKSEHWPTNPGTDGALAIRRCSPASR